MIQTSRRPFAGIVGLVAALAVSTADAQTPLGTAFTYQGRLTDGGTPANGPYDLQLVLFNASAAGTQVGPTVVREDVTVANGLFTIKLDFGATVFTGSARWLEIRVRPGASTGAFTTLSGRQELTPSPNAVFSSTVPWSGITGIPAGFADSVDNDSGGDITAVLAGAGLTGGGSSGSVTLGVNFAGSGAASTASRSDHNHFGQAWIGSFGGNAGLTVANTSTAALGSGIIGTTEASSGRGLYGQANDAATNGAGVSGASFGSGGRGVSGRATVADGYGGYFENTAGGAALWANGPLRTSGFVGTTDLQPLELRVNNVRALRIEPTATIPNLIGGSSGNTLASGIIGATVGGGGGSGSQGNNVTGDHGTVAGGLDNDAGQRGAVGGGAFNSAPNLAATVAGGQSNRATNNVATVGGGNGNLAAGAGSTVPGGEVNHALGDHSFAAGRRARADHAGAFVWADTAVGEFHSDRPNQFKVRAGGGMHLVVANASGLNPPALKVDSTSGNGVALQATQTSSDATLTVHNHGAGDLIRGFGGAVDTLNFIVQNDGDVFAKSYNPNSDRSMKEEIVPVDPTDVLQRVASLPISRWRFQDDPDAVRHIGPMAQDFHRTFEVGPDARHISTTDADGVALAAIQGLVRQLRARTAELEAVEARVATLEAAVKALAAR